MTPGPAYCAPGSGARSPCGAGEGELLRDQILLAAERLLMETGDEDAVSIRGHRRRRGCDGAVDLPPLPGQGDAALRGVRPPVRDVRRGARSRRREDGRPPRGARATVRGVRTLRTRATRGVPHHVHGSVHAGEPAHRHGGEGRDDRVQPPRGCGARAVDAGALRNDVDRSRVRSSSGAACTASRRCSSPSPRSRGATATRSCAGSRGCISTGSVRRRRPSGSVLPWCSIAST